MRWSGLVASDLLSDNGVTMQAHGLSKIVSVKFHKTREPVTATGTTPASIETPLAGPRLEQEEDEPHQHAEMLEIPAVTTSSTVGGDGASHFNSL